MGFTACGRKSQELLNEPITPVFLKQVITMLNIHIPLRSIRTAVQRYSRLSKARTNQAESDCHADNKESTPLNQPSIQKDPPQTQRFETVLNWISVFFRGIARASAIALLITVMLAAIPWFTPEIQPFKTRLLQFIQQYGIPTCSAILIWYGARAAL